MIAESLKIATLLPEAAIRVSRPAEPFSWDAIFEKVSFYLFLN